MDEYKNLELSPEELSLYPEWKLRYERPFEDFKNEYFQSCTDISNSILKKGDSVYFVYGKSLRKGVIEDIVSFSINASPCRIKIKGINKLISAKQTIKY